MGKWIANLFHFFLGFIFAIYVLMQKEKLGRQVKRVLYAYLPEKHADKTVAVGSMAHITFSSFLSGQCLEACILGLLFFIVLTVLRFRGVLHLYCRPHAGAVVYHPVPGDPAD